MLSNIIEVIGWVGAIALATCGIPQFIKTIKTKQADDISWGFALLWLIGEICLIIYTFAHLNSELKLMINYIINIICVLPIVFYKSVKTYNFWAQRKNLQRRQNKLNEVLDLHKKWLNGEEGGQRANLTGANLTGADLSWADLSGANLGGANLGGANLAGADLSGADLSEANLYRANLSGANLAGADLSGANLAGANLRGANLTGADLSGANLAGANLTDVNLTGANLTNAKLPDFQIPQGDDLIVWKQIEENTLVKLRIPKEAKRTGCLINKKCRAEYAEVLEIIGKGRRSIYNKNFVYKVGKVVKPDSYNDDIREDCKPGIHFFMTKEEAEKYL